MFKKQKAVLNSKGGEQREAKILAVKMGRKSFGDQLGVFHRRGLPSVTGSGLHDSSVVTKTEFLVQESTQWVATAVFQCDNAKRRLPGPAGLRRVLRLDRIFPSYRRTPGREVSGTARRVVAGHRTSDAMVREDKDG